MNTVNPAAINNGNATVNSKLNTLKESYIELTSQDAFLRKSIVYMVNHRVQDFADPLTSTLVLMATSPLQMVLCESGLLPFKTSLLPVIPYVYLSEEENKSMQKIISQAPDEFMHETMESSGQYTISIVPMMSNSVFVCKRQLLINFVHVIFKNNKVYGDASICKTLCNIILQRFMARVSIPSDMVTTIVQLIASISGACDDVSDDKVKDMPIFGTTLSKPENAEVICESKKRKKCDSEDSGESDGDDYDDESNDGDKSNEDDCDVIAGSSQCGDD
jgi:hypothetical protein